MSVHVDLSAPELRPQAVLDFIFSLRKDRPTKNLLLKVSPKTFSLFARQLPKDAVKVSKEEAAKINRFLGQSWPASAYAIRGQVKCSKCKRLLTFYDIFMTGRKEHGDEFIKRTLAGSEFHLQLAGRDQRLEVECTACGTLNRLAAKPPKHYCSKKYHYC
jgi:hypothetical protein